MIFKMFSKKPEKMRVLGGPFRGAWVFVNPASSKRKIFGLYEHVLNSWISKTIKNRQFVFDVGANNGYDTYGFATLLMRSGIEKPFVLSVEPSLTPELTTPVTWDFYKKCHIEFIDKFVGSKSGDDVIAIDDLYEKYKQFIFGTGIIKMDIEGGEKEALAGASRVLDMPSIDWLIEIHGKELIPIVANHFVSRNRPFLIKDLTSLPFLKDEKRPMYTTWLLTI